MPLLCMLYPAVDFLTGEGTFAQLAFQWHHRQSFAHLLAAAFGDPLMECKYIDEFTETLAPELYQEARVTEEGIEEEAQEFA